MTPQQIRGLLLEEAMLHLLKTSGYKPIYGKGSDDTLEQEGESLFVKGRGERHQIDAIADYRVKPPFSNPPRLLVEAKFYGSQQVGLSVIRNAVGVLNDVSQFFIAPVGHSTPRRRYHYQYAVVSATQFSDPSQRYAYAHDVFLIPLGKSLFFKGLLEAIRQSAEALAISPSNQTGREFSGRLRSAIRELLADRPLHDANLMELDPLLRRFLRSCFELRFGLIAVTANGFPLFLVPEPELQLSQIEDPMLVRIHRENEGWSLSDIRNHTLFSFDLPIELFNLYAEEGELHSQRALDMKQQELNEMRTVIAGGESLRVVQFLLDLTWIEGIRRRQ